MYNNGSSTQREPEYGVCGSTNFNFYHARARASEKRKSMLNAQSSSHRLRQQWRWGDGGRSSTYIVYKYHKLNWIVSIQSASPPLPFFYLISVSLPAVFSSSLLSFFHTFHECVSLNGGFVYFIVEPKRFRIYDLTTYYVFPIKP